LLQVANRPRWFTVRNGAREYVRRIVAPLDDARLNAPVRAVRRVAGAALVETDAGVERFDEVVLACHSDQSLGLIGAPTAQERGILSAVRYQPNVAWLHTDTALLPRRKAAWAAWNYLARGIHTLDARSVAVTYLLNKLQPLPFTTPLMVTLNPFAEPDAAKVIERIEYAHPVFDATAVAAQRRLPVIQGVDRLWYAGAWTGHGFHEDGFKSGQAVAQAIMQRDAQAAPLRAAA
jgi:predicted NAD/FAD-binding protein